MPTKADIERDKELLQDLGLPYGLHAANWHIKDGELRPNLPCDPYLRHLWMPRGMRPDLFHNMQQADTKNVYAVDSGTVNILEAIVSLINNRGSWESTVSGLREELPVNHTRMGRKLKELVSKLDSQGIHIDHLTRGKQRAIRLRRQ